MQELFAQLGINWKLLLGQGVNFLAVLAILTAVVYRPLMRLIAERRARIEEGVRNAERADERLSEIEQERARVQADAQAQAAAVVKKAEEEAQERRSELTADAQREAEHITERARETAERQKEQALSDVYEHAGELVRNALASAVREKPESVDEALVGQAEKALQSSAPKTTEA